MVCHCGVTVMSHCNLSLCSVAVVVLCGHYSGTVVTMVPLQCDCGGPLGGTVVTVLCHCGDIVVTVVSLRSRC